ncbi:MAG: hypothetical protein IJR26_11410 [Bacteroidales bacterium]|nr:hypothetical protein [Bacteroidales bacterium]
MAKTYPIIDEKPQMLAESAVAYGSVRNYAAPVTGVSTREKVLESTMSVDEYFDELIEQVRHDYANL